MTYSAHGTLPRIINITFTDSTEQSHVFVVQVKSFDISARNGKSFRFAYVENGTGTTYKTVPVNSGYFETFLKFPGTIYISVPSATSPSPEVIEILEWASTD